MTAQNSSENRKPPGRPFRKGVSGNPGGRPKGLSELGERIRQQSRQGAELGDFWLGVMRDKRRRAMTLRLKASELAAAYGFSKPAQPIETETPATIAVVIEKSGAPLPKPVEGRRP